MRVRVRVFAGDGPKSRDQSDGLALALNSSRIGISNLSMTWENEFADIGKAKRGSRRHDAREKGRSESGAEEFRAQRAVGAKFGLD